MRPLWLAGCAVLLLGVSGVAGASATNSSDRGGPVPYTARELVLDRGRLRVVAPGTDIAARAANADPATPTTPTAPVAGAAARRGLGFASAVTSLAAHGEITAGVASADVSAWTAARGALHQLAGTRRSELAAVINTLQAIARSGRLTPARLPELVLTLQSNEQWWTSGPLLAADQRVGFPGSNLVWQYYPGQGIQIQWLGTFGAANGFYDKHDATDLAALLAQALSLAGARGGGIAWEYDFRYDGGRPPWVSAIAQGTAIEALTGAAALLHDNVYLTDAHSALGIFQTPPPIGVAEPAQGGDWYLIYSFAPHYYVINAFIQALVGLFDLAYQGDPAAAQAFQLGNAEAQLALPSYNTGYWSLYDQYGESNLSYHELLTGFLETLCEQTSETTTQAQSVLGTAPPAASTGASGPTSTNGSGGTPAGGTGTSGTTGPSGPSGETGSSGTSGSSGTTGATGSAGPASVYCTTAAAFTNDLKQPPQMTILPLASVRAHRQFDIRFTLSKVSEVTFAVSSGGVNTTIDRSLVPHGTHYFVWRAPHPGSWTIELDAVDLAGNHASQTASLTVTPAA